MIKYNNLLINYTFLKISMDISDDCGASYCQMGSQII